MSQVDFNFAPGTNFLERSRVFGHAEKSLGWREVEDLRVVSSTALEKEKKTSHLRLSSNGHGHRALGGSMVERSLTKLKVQGSNPGWRSCDQL